ncbi:MAG: hypothetical protein KF710_12515 [Rhodocyclaceae bacterium]|nr:hypothetical protein [Rhodocyclaceae bacterium]
MKALRDEILLLSGQIFDLSKWKLLAVASFAVVGLGWGDIKAGKLAG